MKQRVHFLLGQTDQECLGNLLYENLANLLHISIVAD
jgi:hypothetical protein